MTSRPDPLAHLLLWSGAAIFVVAVLVGAAACHSSTVGPQVGDSGIDLDIDVHRPLATPLRQPVHVRPSPPATRTATPRAAQTRPPR